MSRLQLIGLSSIRTGSVVALTTSGTTATWSSDPKFPTIVSPDYLAVTVEPGGANEEVIHVTAHTAGATSSTVVRNAEVVQNGVGSVAHNNAAWSHSVYPTDLNLSTTSKLLGLTSYNPGVATSSNTTSSTPSAVDATNLTVTFTAPSSGSILALLTASAAGNAGIAHCQWGLYESGVLVAGTVMNNISQVSNWERLSAKLNITGLAPGSTHTYVWMKASSDNTSTAFTEYGGPFGSAIMEIRDGGISQSVAQGTDLLSYTYYTPVTNQAIGTTTSATQADLDATHLAVTFTAPASGKVFVELEADAQSVNGDYYWWGLREGSTNITDANGNIRAHTMSPTNTEVRCQVSFLITGLTPGSLHTYKWSHAVGSGTGKTYGGPDQGMAIMHVRDAGTGSGSAPTVTQTSRLLGVCQYLPNTKSTFSASGTALTVADSTNLTVSFVAPASGQVLLRQFAMASASGTANNYFWGVVTHGTTTIAPGSHLVGAGMLSVGLPWSTEQLVTGLTPGQQYQWDWCHSMGAAGTTGSFYAFAVTASENTFNDGPALMQVWDGGISQSVAQGTDLLGFLETSNSATYTVSSTTAADLDATNLAITFTAPASGRVELILSALADGVATNYFQWGLREGASDVAGSYKRMLADPGQFYLTYRHVVTGLTPGSIHTYKWAAFTDGPVTAHLYVGPGGSNAHPPATMEVRDAGIGSGGVVPSSSVLSNVIASDSFVVNPTPVADTVVPGSGGVGTLSVIVPAVTIATTVSVSFYVGFTKTNSARFMVALDGVAATRTNVDGYSTAGDPQIAQGTIPIVVPGDGATHTIALHFNANGDTNAITFRDRSLTVVMSGLGVPSGDTTWTVVGAGGAPAYQNSWAAGNNGIDPNPQFRKLSSGLVVIEGYVISGTGATVAFTLPAGYRPLNRLVFASVDGSFNVTTLQILANGGVQPHTGSAIGQQLTCAFFAEV